METKAKRNDLAVLNGIMFEMMERLNDKSIKGKELKENMERAKAMCDIGKVVVANCALQVELERLRREYGGGKVALPKALEE